MVHKEATFVFKVVYRSFFSLIFEVKIFGVKLKGGQALNQRIKNHHVNFSVNWTSNLGSEAFAVQHEI